MYKNSTYADSRTSNMLGKMPYNSDRNDREPIGCKWQLELTGCTKRLISDRLEGLSWFHHHHVCGQPIVVILQYKWFWLRVHSINAVYVHMCVVRVNRTLARCLKRNAKVRHFAEHTFDKQRALTHTYALFETRSANRLAVV